MTYWYKYKIIPRTDEELSIAKDNKPWRVEVTFNHPLYGECMLLENEIFGKDIYPLYINYKLVESGIERTSKAEDAGIGNMPIKVFREFGY